MSYFSAEVKDGFIYETRSPTNPVGVTTDKYNNILDELNSLIPVFNEYQQLLINLGKEHGKEYIKVPMNQEEMIKQLSDNQNKLSDQLKELQNTIAKLVKKEK